MASFLETITGVGDRCQEDTRARRDAGAYELHLSPAERGRLAHIDAYVELDEAIARRCIIQSQDNSRNR